jgi:hypothetical protein
MATTNTYAPGKEPITPVNIVIYIALLLLIIFS